jgi:DNA polymerase III alpha subunit
MIWADLVDVAKQALLKKNLSKEYQSRLDFELLEIEKQGGTAYWINLFVDKKRFNSNPNNLILPWLLGLMVEEGDIDPIASRNTPLLNTVKMSKVLAYQQSNGFVPGDFTKDPDMPDIDLDCLPSARDPIKQYALEKYGKGLNQDGYGPVCSVGTWQTYKFRSAIIDVCAATGLVEKPEAYELTTSLPDEVDDLKEGGISKCKGTIIQDGDKKECGTQHDLDKCPNCGSEATEGPTLGKLFKEHEKLRLFADAHNDVISYAVRIIGRVRNMGMHAGALIIADRSLYGSVPMAKSKSGYWISMWSEGRNTQLSKFGYVKWDILGLKTLGYIFECCKLIQQNRGISFGKPIKMSGSENEEVLSMSGWEDINPKENRAGHFFDRHGNKHYIDLNDEAVLDLANELKTDAIFQFDTDLAKSILANGVRNFEDLMLFNAMGHPGPMASIPEAVENRDDLTGSWKHKLPVEILPILEDTYGVICYQEQLQSIWQRVAGFTAPEAQEARKAVAKKWVHKLKPIKDKWIEGASRSLGKREAIDWWSKMETFGRYAFNRSHAVSYCLVAHRCLWLKAHFAPEWWASVMSDCHPDKLVRYMDVARSEGWKPTEITRFGEPSCDNVDGVTFDTLNLQNLTRSFIATGNVVNQGLIGIKGIGENAAEQYQGIHSFTDIDDFIEQTGGKNKPVLERFIKLGAFKKYDNHENSKALWIYYQYKYCTGKEITKLKRAINKQLLANQGWTDEAIEKERERQIKEYKATYPNRRKIPQKFFNWKPKPSTSFDDIMVLFKNQSDYDLAKILEFEKNYLGYYLHSPLDLYDIKGNCSIKDAKEYAKNGQEPRLEVVITDINFAETQKGTEYCRLYVSDGEQSALVFIWQNELRGQDAASLVPGTGVQMSVDYDETRGTFSLARGEIILKLYSKSN